MSEENRDVAPVGEEAGAEWDESDGSAEAAEEGALAAFRDSPVGTNDPNIVGDVGPTDTPPGRDPDSDR